MTFHLVALWVLFRAPDLTTACILLNGCLGGASLDNAAGFLGGHVFEGALIVAFCLIHPWDDGRRVSIMVKTLPPIVGVALILMAFCAGNRDRQKVPPNSSILSSEGGTLRGLTPQDGRALL